MTEFEKSIDKEQLLSLLDSIKDAVIASKTKSISIDELKVDFPSQFYCELEYEEQDGKAELELEFKWRTDQSQFSSEEVSEPSTKGRFELFQGKDQKWYFHLRAANHQIILVSQGYASKDGARNGIESIQKNAQSDRFEHRISKAKQPYFVLKAKNGEIIGTSQMYRRKCGCEKGVRSVINHVGESSVFEL